MEEVPDFIEFVTVTVDGDFDTMCLGESSLDVAQLVSVRIRRSDTGIGQELNANGFLAISILSYRGKRQTTNLVGVQTLIELHRLLEVSNDFLLRLVVFVAVRFDGVNAGSVLVPLMLPEALVVSLVVRPEGLHAVEEFFLSVFSQDVGDVGVFALLVAEFLVCAITVVGPEWVSIHRYIKVKLQPIYMNSIY